MLAAPSFSGSIPPLHRPTQTPVIESGCLGYRAPSISGILVDLPIGLPSRSWSNTAAGSGDEPLLRCYCRLSRRHPGDCWRWSPARRSPDRRHGFLYAVRWLLFTVARENFGPRAAQDRTAAALLASIMWSPVAGAKHRASGTPTVALVSTVPALRPTTTWKITLAALGAHHQKPPTCASCGVPGRIFAITRPARFVGTVLIGLVRSITGMNCSR